MSAATSIEQKALFPLTRFMALLLIFLLVVSFVLGALFAYQRLSPAKPVSIPPAEVIDQLKTAPEPEQAPASGSATPQAAATPRGTSPLAGYKIPFPLQHIVASAENAKWLARFLKGEPPEYTEQILRELSEVVQAADAQHVDEADAMNAYHEMKVERIQADVAAKASQQTLMGYFAAAGFGLLLMISMFSLILVLLAIERNTRGRGAAAG